MTRWKREFRQRAKARGFIVWAMPRKWQDWRAAWAYSEVMQYHLLSPDGVEAMSAFAARHTIPALDALHRP